MVEAELTDEPVLRDICEQAKGARQNLRRISDATPNDVRSHMETQVPDPATGAMKTKVVDSHMVILGACPADLKPGQTRMPNGTVITPPST